MNIAHELKALRYLLNDLILQVYDLRIKLEDIEPSKLKYKLVEPNIDGKSISFDMFSIDKDRYNSLVEQFGIDVVNRAVVRLDEFVKINNYIPFKQPVMSLRRKFIKEILFEDKQKESEK